MQSLINRIADDVLMEHLNIPMMGVLDASQKNGSYAVLNVPEDFVDSIYEAIKEDGMEKPDGGAHISVMTGEELDSIKPIEEDGNKYEFKITSIDSVEPFQWDEMERVWFVRCLSTQLEELRTKYGLTPLMNGGHNFHITVAVKPKKKEESKVDKDKMVSRIVKSATWNAEQAEKVTLKYLKNITRSYRDYGMDRVYSSGTNAAHFDLASGGFTLWFEDDEDGVYCEITISGESNVKIDDVFDDAFDGIVFDSERDLVRTLDKSFEEFDDIVTELYPIDEDY